MIKIAAMKNTIAILLLFFSFQFAFAHTEKDSVTRFSFQKMLFEDYDCDACGCSANGGSMGFSSVFNNNFVGVRYFNQQYRSKDGIFNNSPWITENFNTVQVWARIPISDKIQISALVPYHFHDRERSTGNEKIEGLGDITVLAMYTVYQTHQDSTIYTHKFTAGGGFKAPTGKFDIENNKGSVNPGFQVGTGSWDYLLNAEYVIKRKQFGLSSMLNYTFKTENKKLYQFGNQFNYGSTFFYLYEWKKTAFVPQLGIAGEVYGSNSQYRQQVPDSAGDVVFTKFGFEVGRSNFSLGVNAMLPINQNLSNEKVESKYRWALNLNYSL
jgi:hypothetical protein